MTGGTPGFGAESDPDPDPEPDSDADGALAEAPGGLVLMNWRRAGFTGCDSLRYDLRMEAGVIGECAARLALADADGPRLSGDDRGLARHPAVVARPGDVVFDLEGAYLTPGLIDAHVHLGIGQTAAGGARDSGWTSICARRSPPA